MAVWHNGDHRPGLCTGDASAGGTTGCDYSHTLFATGTTIYLQNGGTIEHAQHIANHESPRTTKLYHRTDDAISLDEVERILI